eukprot:s597_g21.t3
MTMLWIRSVPTVLGAGARKYGLSVCYPLFSLSAFLALLLVPQGLKPFLPSADGRQVANLAMAHSFISRLLHDDAWLYFRRSWQMGKSSFIATWHWLCTCAMLCCGNSGNIDDEEVQLRGGKVTDSELDRWKAQALAPEPDVPAAAAPREIVSSFRGQDQSAVQKEAMARLVRSFVRGRALEASSLARGAGSLEASFDRELSQMRLKPLTAEDTLSRLLCAFGSHHMVGMDQTQCCCSRSDREGQAMSLFLRASSKHLQRQASWHRDRVMDEESVATTMVRSVQTLQHPLAPFALGAAQKSQQPAAGAG